MKLTTLIRSLSLLAILLSVSTALLAQTGVKKANHGRSPGKKEVPIDKTADGFSRKTMGEGDRDAAGTHFRNAQTMSKEQIENELKPKGRVQIDSLTKASRSFRGDLRDIPYEEPLKMERPEREAPQINPGVLVPPAGETPEPQIDRSFVKTLLAAAPPTTKNFDGLDFATWGAGHPPDTNGDVGPTYFIQAVNTSIGIYKKSDGSRTAAFTFNSFMSQGSFGNLCDTNNFGDPVVLYDTFEDRWIITDFAFTVDGSGNISSNSFQCFAVSKSGDPVLGGWNFYFTVDTDFLGDYPKFGVWSDGIYSAANMFAKPAGGTFQNPRVKAMNKAQMYAGSPTVQVFSFDAPSNDFALLPSNARLQTGTPPTGRPDLFVSTEQFLNGLSIYKFHADWGHPSLSTFTGPDVQLAPNCWPNATPASAATTGNAADVLAIRAMMQNQYSNIGGVESLWVSHTVQRNVSANNTTCNATTGGNASVRWYQANVTGGTVSANVVQGNTFDPEGANTFFRYMPSVAVDHVGNMAMGYSKSNGTTNPQIKYVGRLVGDPANTITQTEQTLIDGTGSQSGTCGGSTCIRWGDYSAMTLDPDGCTFWYTNEYYVTTGLNDVTRIGAFAYPSPSACAPFANNGSIQGTVTSSATGVPLQGVTVSLGTRSTTTDSSGFYSLSGLPKGVYPSESAAFAGYNTGSASNVSINDASITTQNFSLTVATDANCFADTTQADFQTGTLTNTDIATTPNAVQLADVPVTNQNSTVSPTGFGISNTSWAGQTFTPTVTGKLTRIDLELFCAGCTATSPSVTFSIRATTGATPVPTGADLATATLSGFNDGGAGGLKTVTFSSPITVTALTRYAIIFRNSAAFASGTVAYTCSCATTGFVDSNPYPNGQRVTSTNSGSTWTADTTAGGRDLNFKVYIDAGFSTSGNFVSSTKDSNAAAAGTAVWGTITWNGSAPVNTTLKLQVAASNNQYGPFTFVGPDGTASTSFTTGASLSQFNGFRYLQYKALMTTSDGTVTPQLQDVTICDTNPRVWTGAVSTNWNTAGNWSSSGVPGSSDSAIIPSTGVLNNPTNPTSVSVGTLILGSGRIVTTGANSLTVTNCSTSAISGGDASSFVNGTLIRCVNSAGPYVFPVGTGNGFAPVTLGNIGGTGNFLVGAVNGTLAGANPAQSITRFWTITPTGPTQADITLNYQASDIPGGAIESAFKFMRQNAVGTFAIAPTTFNTTTHTFTLNGVTAFSNWSVGTPLLPTAAGVSISGRAVRPSGVGVYGAIVTLMDSGGNVQTARTNAFGYFTLNDVMVGRTYVVSIQSKQFQFAPQTLMVTDSIADLNFISSN
jgi:hypothetical protein